MSTNFYLKANIPPINLSCKLGIRVNSSFYLEPQFNIGLINRHTWVPFLRELDSHIVDIRDEYDREYSVEEFLKEVGLDGEE